VKFCSNTTEASNPGLIGFANWLCRGLDALAVWGMWLEVLETKKVGSSAPQPASGVN